LIEPGQEIFGVERAFWLLSNLPKDQHFIPQQTGKSRARGVIKN